MPTPQQYCDYKTALYKIFQRRGAIQLPLMSDICNLEYVNNQHVYSVKPAIFDRLLADCKPTGMPGYPFVYVAPQVRELHPEFLYGELNALLNKWITYDFSATLALPEPNRSVKLFMDGVTFPATTFIKGEPTKRSKIARNIYGVSVVMNLMSRLLFGDYVKRLTSTWGECEHKIGIDFYTPEGLRVFTEFNRKLFATAQSFKRRVVSDDVQGWEFQDREWMHDEWHRVHFMHALGLGPFSTEQDALSRVVDHRIYRLYNAFRICDKLAPVMFSDGTFTIRPFYTCLSGRYLTHLQNSDSRAALCMMTVPTEFDFRDVLFEQPICATNGDDCVGLEGDERIYSDLGFVITDRVYQDLRMVNFCSQVFIIDTYGRTLRMPDGLAKLFVNCVSANEEQDYRDCLSNVISHPAFQEFKRAVDSFRRPRLDHLSDQNSKE